MSAAGSEFHSLIISCEHASRRVPSAVAPLFVGQRRLLSSHRAFDKGALEVATAIAGQTKAPLFAGKVTRLVVDLNRSPGHRDVFSEFTRPLPAARRAALARRYHSPYQQRVREACETRIARGRCLHVTIHSFTPVFNGVTRPMDVGLLYDPGRPLGHAVADAWEQALLGIAPRLVVRRNAPYTGVQDGLVPYLRRELPEDAYDGVEIELNQKHFEGNARRRHRMIDVMVRSFAEVWKHCRP